MNEVIIDLKKRENIFEIKEDTHLVAKLLCENSSDVKTSLVVIHRLKDKKSRIDIKVVVRDSSKFEINGLLKIENGASGTNSYLKIDCLMLDDNSYAKAIPSLEINESAVKAGHGGTIGRIDKNMIYYLESRGLDYKDAEDLLVKAFLGEIFIN